MIYNDEICTAHDVCVCVCVCVCARTFIWLTISFTLFTLLLYNDLSITIRKADLSKSSHTREVGI